MKTLKIKKRIIKTLTCIKCLFLQEFSNKYIFVRASVKTNKGVLVNSNFGDDLNIYLLEELTGKKVMILPNSRLSYLLPIKSYLVIGSTITFFSLKNVTIWGAGIINENSISRIKDKPDRIIAVRGPKTRYELIKLGIDCPDVYGDPALLLPKIYIPKKKHKYILGVIPHYNDIDNNNVIRIINEPNTILINIKDYTNWKEIVDLINSCDYIISSSLHGLIIAETYNIPNIWVEFSSYEDGWEFKFIDFYESISKNNQTPLVIDKSVNVDTIIKEMKKWHQGLINDNLINSCPFTIKNNIL